MERTSSGIHGRDDARVKSFSRTLSRGHLSTCEGSLEGHSNWIKFVKGDGMGGSTVRGGSNIGVPHCPTYS